MHKSLNEHVLEHFDLLIFGRYCTVCVKVAAHSDVSDLCSV